MGVYQRLVLIGLSGAGKSTIASLVATALGWSTIDTDAEIEAETRQSIPEIFATSGEAHFRQLERRALCRALARNEVVIATGGGAVANDEVWTPELLNQAETLVVALDVEPQTALARLRAQHEREGAAVERPMIAGTDPLGRISALRSNRLPFYDRAALTLPVNHVDPAILAAELARIIQDRGAAGEATLRLRTPSASSEIHIGAGIADQLGAIVSYTWPKTRRTWVISDTSVAAIHGQRMLANLTQTGLRAELRTVPVGESSKSWAVAGSLLDWLLDGGIERGDVVVALGGGVIGDLAGFVAASVLRGVPLVQAPTSLLAMVDSSIGGKTGVNHRAGKNLIGAFYQPPVVVIDPTFLATLPHRELTAGWAEIIKHAVIQPSTPGGERADLLAFLERNGPALRALKEPAISYAIMRNVDLKRAVVEADEKETGIRAFLNFGHTLGHAIEASDYHLLHGEAIAVGTRAAMRIGQRLNMVAAPDVQRVDDLLDAFSLPATTESAHDQILHKLLSDKKRVAGRQRWVLPLATGGVTIRSDVPERIVGDVLRMVSESRA